MVNPSPIFNQITASTIAGSPSFTGSPTAPTPSGTDNSTTLATTAFVVSKIASATTGVSAVLGNQGAVTLSQLVAGGVAPLASPTFTGTLTASTVAVTSWWNTSYNAGGVIPTGGQGGISYNYTNGGAEIDFWNIHQSPGNSFRWYQTSSTNTVATILLTLGTTGNLTAAGSIAGFGIASTGSLTLQTVSVTSGSSYTVLATDYNVIINKTSGSATAITLPASPATGRTIVIKDGKGDSSTNPITVSPAAGTIDGVSNVILNNPYAAITLVYNGSSWSII